MKTAEEWEKSFNKRLDGTPYYLSTTGYDKWYIRQQREHLEAIRDEQREACAKVFQRAQENIAVDPIIKYIEWVKNTYNAILTAGKAD